MKCFCCLSEELILRDFNSTDRKSYYQLTNLNMDELTLTDQKKICENCRTRLKEFISFTLQCRKSYEVIRKLGLVSKELPSSRRSTRRTNAEKIKIIEEFSNASNSSPFSPVDILHDDEVATEANDREENIQKDHKTIEKGSFGLHFDVGESFSSKLNRSCSSKIWQCDTCGKEFATKFRLTTHIRKIIKVKNDTNRPHDKLYIPSLLQNDPQVSIPRRSLTSVKFVVSVSLREMLWNAIDGFTLMSVHSFVNTVRKASLKRRL